MHILIDFDEAEVERSIASRATAIDRTVFVATDLEKYTTYGDVIKSNIQLNESSNFATDFKGSRTITCKLQAREQTEGSHFRCRKFSFISKLVL